MADVVHEHTTDSSNNSGMGFFMGMVLIVVVLLLIFYFGLPYLRNAASNSGSQINVPDKIDVNISQPKE